MNQKRTGFDPVISAVLDQIFELTQIDPASVSPDDRLQKELGLDRQQVQKLLWKSAQNLAINISLDNCRVGDPTLREIVTILKSFQNLGPESDWKLASG